MVDQEQICHQLINSQHPKEFQPMPLNILIHKDMVVIGNKVLCTLVDCHEGMVCWRDQRLSARVNYSEAAACSGNTYNLC